MAFIFQCIQVVVARLINTRTHSAPPVLRRAVALAYHRRRWGMLSVALQHTVTTCLLDDPGLVAAPGAGPGASARCETAFACPATARGIDTRAICGSVACCFITGICRGD